MTSSSGCTVRVTTSSTQYDERGWRATFYVTGMEHSATSATASAFEDTPWRAVQRAAWAALTARAPAGAMNQHDDIGRDFAAFLYISDRSQFVRSRASRSRL